MQDVFYPQVLLFLDHTPLSVSIVRRIVNMSCKVVVVSKDEEKWREEFRNFTPGFCELVSAYDIANLNTQKNYSYLLYADLGSSLDLDKRKDLISKARTIAIQNSAKVLFIFSQKQEEKSAVRLKQLASDILSQTNLYAGILYLGDVYDSHGYFKEKVFSGKKKIVLRADNFFPIPYKKASQKIIKELFSMSAYEKSTAISSAVLPFSNLKTLVKRAAPKISLVKKENKFSILDSQEKILVKLDKKAFQDYLRANLKSKNSFDSSIEKVKRLSPSPSSIVSSVKKPTERQISQIKNITIPSVSVDYQSSFSHMGLTTTTSQKTKEKKINAAKKKINKSKKNIDSKSLFQRIVHKLPRDRASLKANSFKILRSRFLLRMFLGGFLTSFFVLLFVPTLLFMTSFSSFFIAKKTFTSGNLALSEKAFTVAKRSSHNLAKYTLSFSDVPYYASFVRPMSQSSFLFTKASKIGLRSISFIKTLMEFSKNIADSRAYDPNLYSERLFLESDNLYKQLSFLEGEISNMPRFYQRIFSFSVGEDLSQLRKNILGFSRLAKNMPVLLGSKKPAKYLILYQDDSYLRPTGGIIKYVGLATFTNGKLLDIKVYPSSDLNKNVAGEVSAPSALSKYFEKRIWQIQDANWDADFAKSAKQAEWFLDKQMAETVTGTVAVNMSLLTDVFGQKNFSSNSLEDATLKIINMKEGEKLSLLDRFLDALTQKDVQFSFNDDSIAKNLKVAGWSGTVFDDECQGNCYKDFIAIVEALTEDSITKGVTKDASLDFSIEDATLKRTLELNLKNQLSDFSADNVAYKSYIRVIAREDSGFSPVKIITDGNVENLMAEVYGKNDYKEAGVFVEVLPGQSKQIVFSWEGPFTKTLEEEGTYYLSVIKQSGGNIYPFSFNLFMPYKAEIVSEPEFFLTGGGFFTYNTTLTKDTSLRINWLPK